MTIQFRGTASIDAKAIRKRFGQQVVEELNQPLPSLMPNASPTSPNRLTSNFSPNEPRKTSPLVRGGALMPVSCPPQKVTKLTL